MVYDILLDPKDPKYVKNIFNTRLKEVIDIWTAKVNTNSIITDQQDTHKKIIIKNYTIPIAYLIYSFIYTKYFNYEFKKNIQIQNNLNYDMYKFFFSHQNPIIKKVNVFFYTEFKQSNLNANKNIRDLFVYDQIEKDKLTIIQFLNDYIKRLEDKYKPDSIKYTTITDNFKKCIISMNNILKNLYIILDTALPEARAAKLAGTSPKIEIEKFLEVYIRDSRGVSLYDLSKIDEDLIDDYKIDLTNNTITVEDSSSTIILTINGKNSFAEIIENTYEIINNNLKYTPNISLLIKKINNNYINIIEYIATINSLELKSNFNFIKDSDINLIKMFDGYNIYNNKLKNVNKNLNMEETLIENIEQIKDNLENQKDIYEIISEDSNNNNDKNKIYLDEINKIDKNIIKNISDTIISINKIINYNKSTLLNTTNHINNYKKIINNINTIEEQTIDYTIYNFFKLFLMCLFINEKYEHFYLNIKLKSKSAINQLTIESKEINNIKFKFNKYFRIYKKEKKDDKDYLDEKKKIIDNILDKVKKNEEIPVKRGGAYGQSRYSQPITYKSTSSSASKSAISKSTMSAINEQQQYEEYVITLRDIKTYIDTQVFIDEAVNKFYKDGQNCNFQNNFENFMVIYKLTNSTIDLFKVDSAESMKKAVKDIPNVCNQIKIVYNDIKNSFEKSHITAAIISISSEKYNNDIYKIFGYVTAKYCKLLINDNASAKKFFEPDPLIKSNNKINFITKFFNIFTTISKDIDNTKKSIEISVYVGYCIINFLNYIIYNMYNYYSYFYVKSEIEFNNDINSICDEIKIKINNDEYANDNYGFLIFYDIYNIIYNYFTNTTVNTNEKRTPGTYKSIINNYIVDLPYNNSKKIKDYNINMLREHYCELYINREFKKKYEDIAIFNQVRANNAINQNIDYININCDSTKFYKPNPNFLKLYIILDKFNFIDIYYTNIIKNNINRGTCTDKAFTEDFNNKLGDILSTNKNFNIDLYKNNYKKEDLTKKNIFEIIDILYKFYNDMKIQKNLEIIRKNKEPSLIKNQIEKNIKEEIKIDKLKNIKISSLKNLKTQIDTIKSSANNNINIKKMEQDTFDNLFNQLYASSLSYEEAIDKNLYQKSINKLNYLYSKDKKNKKFIDIINSISDELITLTTTNDINNKIEKITINLINYFENKKFYFNEVTNDIFNKNKSENIEIFFNKYKELNDELIIKITDILNNINTGMLIINDKTINQKTIKLFFDNIINNKLKKKIKINENEDNYQKNVNDDKIKIGKITKILPYSDTLLYYFTDLSIIIDYLTFFYK